MTPGHHLRVRFAALAGYALALTLMTSGGAFARVVPAPQALHRRCTDGELCRAERAPGADVGHNNQRSCRQPPHRPGTSYRGLGGDGRRLDGWMSHATIIAIATTCARSTAAAGISGTLG